MFAASILFFTATALFLQPENVFAQSLSDSYKSSQEKKQNVKNVCSTARNAAQYYYPKSVRSDGSVYLYYVQPSTQNVIGVNVSADGSYKCRTHRVIGKVDAFETACQMQGSYYQRTKMEAQFKVESDGLILYEKNSLIDCSTNRPNFDGAVTRKIFPSVSKLQSNRQKLAKKQRIKDRIAEGKRIYVSAIKNGALPELNADIKVRGDIHVKPPYGNLRGEIDGVYVIKEQFEQYLKDTRLLKGFLRVWVKNAKANSESNYGTGDIQNGYSGKYICNLDWELFEEGAVGPEYWTECGGQKRSIENQYFFDVVPGENGSLKCSIVRETPDGGKSRLYLLRSGKLIDDCPDFFSGRAR